MAIQIKLKNSVVQDSTPSTSDLPAVGEIALNANINSIGGFMRASDNSIVKIFGPGSLSTPTATTTVSGISELATNSETTTGTATNRVVTPAGLNAVTVAERSTSNSTYLALAGGTLTGVVAATAGSNSAPSIHFGDSDSGIFGGTNTVSLAAGGTTRLTADTGVSVVGTLAVTGAITSTSDLTIADKIIHAGDTNTAIRFPAADTVSVETGGSEALRVDSSGRLLVGQSASVNVGSTTAGFLQIASSTGTINSSFAAYGNNSSPCMIAIGRSRSGTVGSAGTALQNNDIIGLIRFAGDDGTDLQSQAASIAVEVDGTPGSNDMPGRLVFSTTADGAASPTTRLTIDSAGLVKLPDNGKFVAGDSSDLQIYHDGSHSHIREVGTGDLRLRSDKILLMNENSEEFFVGTSNGSVELYYDDSKKFETTSTGVSFNDGNITNVGSIALDSIKGDADDNTNITFATNDVITFKCGSTSPALTVNTTQVKVEDNQKFVAGAGNDLQIYHNGSNTFIDNSTGVTNIRGGTHKFRKLSDNEDMLILNPNSSVDLYFDNSIKLNTNSAGIRFYGSLRGIDNEKLELGSSQDLQIYHDGTNNIINDANSAKIKIQRGGSDVWELKSTGLQGIDNQKLMLGTSDDLEIYHNGSNSFINNNTGHLQIVSGGGFRCRAASHILNSHNDQENIIKGFENGAAELYYDGSKKLETTSTGATVTGILRADEIRMGDSGGATSPNERIRLGNSEDLEIYHDGTNSIIQNNTGVFYLKTLNGEFTLVGRPAGSTELYYDHSKKLETKSDGVQITDVNPVVHIQGTGTSGDSALFLDANANHWVVRADNNTGSGTFSIKSGTPSSSTHRLLISNTGRVGIGTASPNKKLEIMEDTDSAAVLRVNRSTNVDSTQRDFIEFMRGSTAVGFIKATNSSVAYQTSSDYRLKENAVAISDGITRLKTLKPYRFNFKINPGITVDGFFAHEVTAVPEAISGTKDEVDSDNNPVYQGIDQSKLVPLLVAAVQELIGRVEKLEAA